MKVGDKFKYKGVDFEVLRVGKKAILLDAKADFLNGKCLEVWMIRQRKDGTINGKFVKGGFKKPSNNDYPFTAHQFLETHFISDEQLTLHALHRFQEYETGVRPKAFLRITSSDLSND